MDDRRIAFLTAVLGADGAKALQKAAERSSELGNALVPRTILAWLGTTRDGYEGELPGLGKTHIAFSKSEDGYSGAVTIADDTYRFEKASLFHLAASVAVAIGVKEESVGDGLRDFDVERLGKSIDLLAKAKMLGKELAKADGKKKCEGCGKQIDYWNPKVGPKSTARNCSKCCDKVEDLEKKAANPGGTAGPSAAPTAPTPPTAPTGAAPVAPAPKPQIQKPKTAKPAKPTASYTLKVTKAERERACPVCGGHNFNGVYFLGCMCFKDLVKYAKVSAAEDSFVLTLGTEWDREAIVTFLESLGRN